MPDTKNKIIIAYVPVLHEGYIKFFEKFKGSSLFLINPEGLATDQFKYLSKDIRCIKPKNLIKPLLATKLFKDVKILQFSEIKSLDSEKNKIILPDDDISEYLQSFFKKSRVTLYGVFLRWDRRNVEGVNIELADELSTIDYDLEKMKQAVQVSYKSLDIWRRVGAVLVLSDGKVISAYNSGEPTSISPIMVGDPRNIFKRGVAIEMSSFSHAEAVLIAESAKKGMSTDGASIYITDYPCPACSKLIARSGIKNVFYKEGYAVLDGKMVLDEYGVKIKKVIIDDLTDPHPEVWIPYK